MTFVVPTCKFISKVLKLRASARNLAKWPADAAKSKFKLIASSTLTKPVHAELESA